MQLEGTRHLIDTEHEHPRERYRRVNRVHIMCMLRSNGSDRRVGHGRFAHSLATANGIATAIISTIGCPDGGFPHTPARTNGAAPARPLGHRAHNGVYVRSRQHTGRLPPSCVFFFLVWGLGRLEKRNHELTRAQNPVSILPGEGPEPRNSTSTLPYAPVVDGNRQLMVAMELTMSLPLDGHTCP